MQPSGNPSSQPSVQPSMRPTEQPTTQPSVQPSLRPTQQPSAQPTVQPTTRPSTVPSADPTIAPSGQPSDQPSTHPSGQPSVHPTLQPSGQPSRQPSSQPSMQPAKQPSSQPSRQPSRQPTRQPTAQPTHSPTETQFITTGEWILALSTNLTVVDVTSAVVENVWVCGRETSIACVVVDAKSGLLNTKYTLPWDEVVSVLATEDTNAVVIGATSTRNGVAYSEIAVCDFSASLLCAVFELTDTTFDTAVAVSYTEQTLYLGLYSNLPMVNIMEPSNIAGSVGSVRSYVYTPSAVRSVKLAQVASVPNFAGVFVGGTGNILENGATMPVIVAGWVSSSSGMLNAMYITPVGSAIATDADLVNAIAIVGVGPDSLIGGALKTGSGGVTTAYFVRSNSLYKTTSYGVRYLSKANTRTRSVVKGMVSEGSVVYLLVNIAPPTSQNVVAVLKVNIATGAILQQMSLSLQYVNVTCSGIKATALALCLTCAVQETEQTIRSLLLATTRDLFFRRLPLGWTRNSTISFTRQLTPFSVTSFAAPAASKVIPISSFTYSTLGQTPTWRPTTAPTIQLSSQPTVRLSVQPSGMPSAQPSSSPTSAPSISPQPTSHPSTGGPTNTYKPTVKPTLHPSASPSLSPTVKPSERPSVVPSVEPSVLPSTHPSAPPLVAPTKSPTVDPTLAPTRWLTARPSRVTASTAAPSATDSTGIGSMLPTADIQNKEGGITEETIVIGVGAAGGALGFGCIAIMLCAACSYKLRKNREKYVERRKTLQPSKDIHALTAEVRRIETLKVLKGVLTPAPKSAILGATQRTTAVQAARSLEAASSDGTSSVYSSCLEMSSLHSSELSDADYTYADEVPNPNSVRRLSEIEAQRDLLHSDESENGNKYFDESDESSIEQRFNEIMAEFSDEGSWDSYLA